MHNSRVPRLEVGQTFELPLTQEQRSAFCGELGGNYALVGEVTFIPSIPDDKERLLQVKSVGTLWLSEFITNWSSNNNTDNFTSDNLFNYGYPKPYCIDPLSPIQKKLKFFIDREIIAAKGGRQNRRYSINPGFSGIIKYLNSFRYNRSVADVYEIDLI